MAVRVRIILRRGGGIINSHKKAHMRKVVSERGNSKKRVRSQRLKPEERKRQIVAAAAQLFAEHGFEAGTSELADRLGITQPLMYRYFRSKEELLKQVYSEAYAVDEFYPKWERLISDHSLGMKERLVQFYEEYSELTWNYTFTRMAMWANLSRPTMNKIYYETVRQRIFPRMVRALRIAYGQSNLRTTPTEYELEMVHSLHGMMYHLAIRRWVHAKRVTGDVGPLIGLKVDLFLQGAAQIMKSRPNGTDDAETYKNKVAR